MAGESAPSSPAAGAAPKRPSLVHRHSSQSTVTSAVSQSPGDGHGHGHGHGHGRPGYHKAHSHKHLVGHHGRTGRNPSFHRSLSKIKINTATGHVVEDDAPPTPKAKHHRRTASTSGAAGATGAGAGAGAASASATPASPQVPPSPGVKAGHGMKRNNTSLALPRTASQAALKKNHSSGQLSRLGSSRNVAGHGHKTARQERPDLRRAHTQPVKRHKSPAPEGRQATVHFNVGSDDDDDVQEMMEGVDDVWTEDSASASPNTTRDNTRNNTRHNSIVLDPVQNPYAQRAQSRQEDKPPDIYIEDTASAPTSTSAPAQSPGLLVTSSTRDFAKPDAVKIVVDQEPEQQQQRQSPSKEQHKQQPQQQQQPELEPESTSEPEVELQPAPKPKADLARPAQPQFDLPFRQQEHQRQHHEELRRAQQQKLREQQEQEDADEDDDDDDDNDNDDDVDDNDDDEQDDDEDDDPDSDATASNETLNPRPRPQSQQFQLQQHHPQQQQQPQLRQQHSQTSHQSRPLDTDLIARRLLEKNAPAPPRVSSISALANASTTNVKSLSQSQNGNLHPTGANNTPVVSRFVGPDDGIGSKDGTPRNQSGFLRSHSRTNSINKGREGMRRGDSISSTNGNLQRNKSAPNFASQDRGVQSPTSQSGTQTPTGAAFENNSRTQQKLWLQRGLSNIEASSTPHLPGLLPTGRAQAMRTPQKGMQFEFVDREYAVVRRFHNPLLEAIERLRSSYGGTLPGRPKAILPAPPPTASSAASTANGSVKRPETSKSTKSVKSVKSNASMAAGSTRSAPERESAGQRARVSFHTGASPDPESGRQSPADSDVEGDDQDTDGSATTMSGVQRAPTAADIARRIWEGGIVSA